jgi:hypothetical protein
MHETQLGYLASASIRPSLAIVLSEDRDGYVRNALTQAHL